MLTLCSLCSQKLRKLVILKCDPTCKQVYQVTLNQVICHFSIWGLFLMPQMGKLAIADLRLELSFKCGV